MNFTVNGESISKKLARDERMINYYDFFFKQVILSLKTLFFKKDLVHCRIYQLIYFVET